MRLQIVSFTSLLSILCVWHSLQCLSEELETLYRPPFSQTHNMQLLQCQSSSRLGCSTSSLDIAYCRSRNSDPCSGRGGCGRFSFLVKVDDVMASREADHYFMYRF